jgi:signal transduction histidine kinase
VGLAAVRDVCRNLQGSIDVESEPGRGTVFRMVIPARQQSLRPARPVPTVSAV